ncbi:MAG: hypothetical protein JKY37_06950 [Nannocystaceae bacterium]|nr:hypothetical protein [Nannocystaceae bacterium]
MRARALAVCCLAFTFGCDAEPNPPSSTETMATSETEHVQFRCSASSLPALGGLEYVELSGGATVRGGERPFDVFSNGKLVVGRGTSVGGGLYSAVGAISVAAGAFVLGDIKSSGPEVPPHLPIEEAKFVAENSHNAMIGLTANGRTPISKGAIHLYGGDSLQFPNYYYYVDGLQLSGESNLALSYTVTYLFVDGPIEISGGSSIGTSQAKHLLIISMSKEPISISGASTNVIARIYAPYAPIYITDGASVEGAVVGRTLEMSGESTMEVTQDGLHIWYPC